MDYCELSKSLISIFIILVCLFVFYCIELVSFPLETPFYKSDKRCISSDLINH